MNLRLIGITAALTLLLAPITATAHKAWLHPSATVFSDTGAWVTVDAAVSNDLFHFNHVPLRLDGLQVTAPDGSRIQPQNSATGKYRSVFDLELTQEGTYKLMVLNDGIFAQYQLNGERKRWRGTPASFNSELPAGATDVVVTESMGRIETFATVGSPTTSVFNVEGTGIELVPVTHPNDLYAGEAATFQLLVDGTPAKGLEVELTPGASRYRDQQDEIKLVTDAKGQFKVTWPQPGMYWMETSRSDALTSLPDAKQRRLSYSATFEVLPQ